jgi:uncharacterized protein
VFNLLKNTFIHIQGISKETEAKIWQNDILNWEEFIDKHDKLDMNSNKKDKICSQLNKSIKCYQKNAYSFLIDNIPGSMHWRAYKELKRNCCFLDIETTGLDKHRDDITTIAVYDGKKSEVFIRGQNMDDFSNAIKKYDMIVSFNGRCFDIPFLKNKFPKINLDKFHCDLRFGMKELGYAGGLKKIEKEIGICRDDDLDGVDGFEAVRLWYKYKKGDQAALDKLVKYNIADVENLKVMMEFAFEKLKEKNFHSVI